MTKTTIPEKTITTCDRCRAELTKENTKESRYNMTGATRFWHINKRVVLHPISGRPYPLQADIHFCDGCWWEFDMLFCTGQALNMAPGRAHYTPTPEHGRSGVPREVKA